MLVHGHAKMRSRVVRRLFAGIFALPFSDAGRFPDPTCLLAVMADE